jgi:hypothetical protein
VFSSYWHGLETEIGGDKFALTKSWYVVGHQTAADTLPWKTAAMA